MHKLYLPAILFCLMVALVLGGFELAYWQKIYPGVTVAEVDLGGLKVDSATQTLAERLQTQTLVLKWGTSEWQIVPEQINLEYDVTQTVDKAYAFGRQGSLWNNLKDHVYSLYKPVTIPPVFSWDENQLVATTASISAQINIPAREPEVQLEEDLVVVLTGEAGQAVDERELRHRLQSQIATLSKDPIEIPVIYIQPQLTQEQAEEMRVRGEKIVDRNLTLQLEHTSWNTENRQILSWIEAGGWNRSLIDNWVSQLAVSINRPAQNALFTYLGSGRVEEFQPARDGLALNQTELTSQILSSLDKLAREESVGPITVPVSRTTPTISTGDVNNLGINELIGRGESDYSGSIVNRIFNLKKAAANMHGVLIPPGEIFSFNQYVGDISAEGGYRQAYIIKDGKTILGDGGGVCQVSTTVFRAALNSGLPIVERTAHAYRVHYYEQDRGPGYDATIFTPSVDFKFKNDTSGHILIQTQIDETRRKLVFEFYGTSDGRQVTLTKPKVWDVVAPPPDLYTDDPTLPPGTVKQVDWKAWGAKASFDYKVTRGDEVLQERTFYSNFRPWQAVFLRGPSS